MCKFDGDPAICPREEAICAKVYRLTDGQTTDAARLYKLMDELKMNKKCNYNYLNFNNCSVLTKTDIHANQASVSYKH